MNIVVGASPFQSTVRSVTMILLACLVVAASAPTTTAQEYSGNPHCDAATGNPHEEGSTGDPHEQGATGDPHDEGATGNPHEGDSNPHSDCGDGGGGEGPTVEPTCALDGIICVASTFSCHAEGQGSGGIGGPDGAQATNEAAASCTQGDVLGRILTPDGRSARFVVGVPGFRVAFTNTVTVPTDGGPPRTEGSVEADGI